MEALIIYLFKYKHVSIQLNSHLYELTCIIVKFEWEANCKTSRKFLQLKNNILVIKQPEALFTHFVEIEKTPSHVANVQSENSRMLDLVA